MIAEQRLEEILNTIHGERTKDNACANAILLGITQKPEYIERAVRYYEIRASQELQTIHRQIKEKKDPEFYKERCERERKIARFFSSMLGKTRTEQTDENSEKYIQIFKEAEKPIEEYYALKDELTRKIEQIAIKEGLVEERWKGLAYLFRDREFINKIGETRTLELMRKSGCWQLAYDLCKNQTRPFPIWLISQAKRDVGNGIILAETGNICIGYDWLHFTYRHSGKLKDLLEANLISKFAESMGDVTANISLFYSIFPQEIAEEISKDIIAGVNPKQILDYTLEQNRKLDINFDENRVRMYGELVELDWNKYDLIREKINP